MDEIFISDIDFSLPITSAGATTQRDGVEVQRGPFAVPQPGEECPLCHEKTPNKHALAVRAWRAKRKEKP